MKRLNVPHAMLASHFHLSAVDRDSIVQIFKGLYVERRADMDDEIPSLPAGRLAGTNGRCPP